MRNVRNSLSESYTWVWHTSHPCVNPSGFPVLKGWKHTGKIPNLHLSRQTKYVQINWLWVIHLDCVAPLQVVVPRSSPHHHREQPQLLHIQGSEEGSHWEVQQAAGQHQHHHTRHHSHHEGEEGGQEEHRGGHTGEVLGQSEMSDLHQLYHGHRAGGGLSLCHTGLSGGGQQTQSGEEKTRGEIHQVESVVCVMLTCHVSINCSASELRLSVVLISIAVIFIMSSLPRLTIMMYDVIIIESWKWGLWVVLLSWSSPGPAQVMHGCGVLGRRIPSVEPPARLRLSRPAELRALR